MTCLAHIRLHLRQLLRLPVPFVATLPVWLNTMRSLLGADGGLALWWEDAEGPPFFLASHAHDIGCESFASSGWRPIDVGGACAGRVNASLTSAPPAVRALLEGRGDGEMLSTWVGARRLWVGLTRRAGAARYNARLVALFEALTAELSCQVASPLPKCLAATCGPSEGRPAASAGDAAARDASVGTLVMCDATTRWLDRHAWQALRCAWRMHPDGRWPDIAPVAMACERLAREQDAAQVGDAVSPRDACERMYVPGGEVHLRAATMMNAHGHRSALVRVQLQRHVPPELAWFKRLSGTSLSPVQREVALRLACGQTREAVRTACDIGNETLKTHLALARARLDPAVDAELLAILAGAVRSGKPTRRLE